MAEMAEIGEVLPHLGIGKAEQLAKLARADRRPPSRTKCCNSRKYRLSRLTTTAGTSRGGVRLVFAWKSAHLRSVEVSR